MAATQRERINFSKIKEVIDFPNRIEIQKKSYAEFLQLGVDKTKRVEDGLEAVFKEVFPIESYDGSITLDFHSYEIRPPKQTWLESLDDGGTQAALYVTFHLKEGKQVKEEEVFRARYPDDPIRQLRNQWRGADCEPVAPFAGAGLRTSRMPTARHCIRSDHPDRGSWFEAQFDTNDLLYVYLDRKKRRA